MSKVASVASEELSRPTCERTNDINEKNSNPKKFQLSEWSGKYEGV